MVMEVAIHTRAETVHRCYRPEPRPGAGPRAGLAKLRFEDPQEDAQHRASPKRCWSSLRCSNQMSFTSRRCHCCHRWLGMHEVRAASTGVRLHNAATLPFEKVTRVEANR